MSTVPASYDAHTAVVIPFPARSSVVDPEPDPASPAAMPLEAAA